MYYNFAVEFPDVPGKLVKEKKGDEIVIKYIVGRKYDPEKKYSKPERVTIGRLDKDDNTKIRPNQNFLTYFPDIINQYLEYNVSRSSLLHIGNFSLFKKILSEYQLDTYLKKYFKDRNYGLLLDLVYYSIVCEDNVNQYFPDYSYNHPLNTPNMRIYSDSTVSDFLSQSITDNDIQGFLNDWNKDMNHKTKIYISYDSTNKNSKAGDVEFVEFGKPKVDTGSKVLNYAMAYNVNNNIPLFYEAYLGSLTDVTQLKYTIEKTYAYGYRYIGFIIDRGYFSKQNIDLLDEHGYSFIIMMKGHKDLVSDFILSLKGKFEEDMTYETDFQGVYGTTLRGKFSSSDTKIRYFHVYYSAKKNYAERETLELKIRSYCEMLDKLKNKECEDFPNDIKKYFILHYDTKNPKLFLTYEKNGDVISDELKKCGYFVIISSLNMTAKDALKLYKGRDVSEKLFRGDKSYLGNKSMRVHSTESTKAKIFIEFIALIIRNKIYTTLIEEQRRVNKHINYMSVPAAIKELEKIEIVRQADGIYRLDHALTAKQKALLKCFNIEPSTIFEDAKEISDIIKESQGLCNEEIR